MAHFESSGVFQVGEKRLDKVAFLCWNDYDIGVAFEPGKRLEFSELGPISDVGVQAAQIEGKGPRVFAGQGDGHERP